MAKIHSLLKIGCAGLHFPIMAAIENGVFQMAKSLLDQCAFENRFELSIWPNLIHDTEEAEKAARFFEAQGIDFLLIQSSSFAMGDAVLPLVEHTPRIGLWVLDEPTYSGELPLNSLTGFNLCASLVRGAYGDRKKIKWFRGTGRDFGLRLAATARALSALKAIAGCRIVSIGGVVPSFGNLEYSRDSFEKSLQVDVERVELQNLFGLAESASTPEVATIVAHLSERAACVRVDAASLENTARICHAIRSVRDREGADAAALRCWPEFQEWQGIAPCAAVSWANDNCMPTACEGDVPGAVAMLVGTILSGSAATMNDPVALDDGSGSVQMWHCGPGPASWADERGQCLDYHHTLNRRLTKGAPRAGVSSDIRFAHGPVTILRVRGDGRTLFVLEGEVVDGPAPPYPGSGGWIGNLRMGEDRVSPDDLLHMMAAYGLEHHYPVMRGHHGADLVEMAAWAGWSILPRLDSRASPVV
jgi:L-fucose isomerase-like protein